MGFVRNLVFAGALCALLGANAQAEQVSYAFSVRISEIDQFTGQNLTAQLASVAYPAGGQLSVGDVLTGKFSFDPDLMAAPPAQQTASSRYLADMTGGAHNLSFAIPGGSPYSSPNPGSAGIVQIGHESGSDYFAIGDYDENLAAALLLANWNGGVFHSLDLPKNLELSTLPYTWFNVGWRSGQDQQISVTGAVVSLTPLSPVPEPSSWLMLLAGVAALVSLRRYSR